MTLGQFQGRMSRRSPFRAYRIDDATCDARRCLVQAKMTYDHRKMKGVTTPVVESWIIDARQTSVSFTRPN